MVSAQFLLSLDYAQYNSTVEKRRREGGKKKKEKRKTCKSRLGAGRILLTKKLRQATGILNLFNSKDTRGEKREECGRRHTLFLLKRAVGTVISLDEVMRVTCSILSSEFGHGLVKAEPFLAPSELPQTQDGGIKKPGMAE